MTDLAEQLFYAKNHQLPDSAQFSVHAVEKPGAANGLVPVYNVSVVLAAGSPALQYELKINGPIWSPDVYKDLMPLLAKKAGMGEPAPGNESGDTVLLKSLTSSLASNIESQNQKLSKKLEASFGSPVLHEEAALLLGAFALREHSGDFYDIRSPLCRITAHLCMARYLAGGKPFGITGQVAEAMLLTLMNNQTTALTKLASLGNDDPAVAEWVRALQARNTLDYRPLTGAQNASPVERIEWFNAIGNSVDLDVAWNQLTDAEKQMPDFVRVANGLDYSVQTGHQLLHLTLPLELGEMTTVYEWSEGKKLQQADMVGELNKMPERCFSSDENGKPVVRVIGWGQWAMFFQRQLGHALEHNFDFLQNRWGVPDDAANFSSQAGKMFDGLRLYPFVRRFNTVDSSSYHKSVDDGFKLTVESPQLVPAECWNYLCYEAPSHELYQPNPNPHVNEWHKYNPPPGTAYNPRPRLDHPSLISRSDSQKLITDLHELRPP